MVLYFVSRPKLSRPGEAKTTRRVVWEFIHGAGGRSAIALGFVNISLGVFLALAHFLIWCVWFAYLGFILLAHFIAEIVLTYRRKREASLARRIAVANKYIIKAQNLEVEKNEFNTSMEDPLTPRQKNM